jgi:hypothetical protein
MVSDLRLIDARADRDAVWALAHEVRGAGWGDFELRIQLRDYFSAVALGQLNDLSVALLVGGRPVGLALANDAYDKIGYFGRPIFLAAAPDADCGDIGGRLFDHFREVARLRKQAVAFVVPQAGKGAFAPERMRACSNAAMPQTRRRGVIDLAQSETEIRRGVRKSYRSLINWGKRSLQTLIVDRTNPDKTTFDSFQEFHCAVAGRRTRSQESWNEMYANVCAGSAELIAAYLDSKLVAATFVNYSAACALYSSGVYDRELFDKPLAHWPLYLSIMRAKEKGIRYFDLGEVYLGADAGAGNKDNSIGFFKKGFTDRIETDEIWSFDAREATEVVVRDAAEMMRS